MDEKLQPWFYGTYKILRKIGEVVYELEMPPKRKVHNVFHVSFLKKEVVQQIVVSEVPPIDDEGHLILVLEKVL